VRAADVRWLEADVTHAAVPAGAFGVWHDRAVFHFLSALDDRARSAAAAVRPGDTVILATFAPDGPPRCSGLQVARYTAESLADELGGAFALVRGFSDMYHTPAGGKQRFSVVVLRRQ
jgi:hypothetical protein